MPDQPHRPWQPGRFRNLRQPGSNCVFIRTLTDDVYLQLLFFIEVTGEATESGIAVIPDQRIVSKVTATDGFFLDKRMFFWSNYNHILVQNGYKGNIRFIRNERTKDHIVAVGFEPLDHICSVRLVKIEGYMLVAVYIQEGSHCMRNIVVCQRKYIGDINMVRRFRQAASSYARQYVPPRGSG